MFLFLFLFYNRLGNYWSNQGTGIKAKSGNVTTKEIFKIVDSDAQVTLRANNNKWVAFQVCYQAIIIMIMNR